MIPKKSGSLWADKMRLINLVQPCLINLQPWIVIDLWSTLKNTNCLLLNRMDLGKIFPPFNMPPIRFSCLITSGSPKPKLSFVQMMPNPVMIALYLWQLSYVYVAWDFNQPPFVPCFIPYNACTIIPALHMEHLPRIMTPYYWLIITMYHKGILPLMTPDEKVLFTSPLESLLRLRPPSKRAWIASVEASHCLCLLQHNSFMPWERDFMTTFLGRTVSRN